jgi:FKBP-type peptidyl-prolyl cis-trans isomerase
MELIICCLVLGLVVANSAFTLLGFSPEEIDLVMGDGDEAQKHKVILDVSVRQYRLMFEAFVKKYRKENKLKKLPKELEPQLRKVFSLEDGQKLQDAAEYLADPARRQAAYKYHTRTPQEKAEQRARAREMANSEFVKQLEEQYKLPGDGQKPAPPSPKRLNNKGGTNG